jgi:hypothetical protein
MLARLKLLRRSCKMFRGKLIKGTVFTGLTAFVLALAVNVLIAAEPVTVDAGIAPYSKVSGISGNLSSIGS